MNQDKRANRYSLKIIDIDGNENIIPITYNGKSLKKMPLTIIDMMTANYSKEAFKQSLLESGYNYGYIFIEYKMGGERRTLDVVYNNETIKRESSFRQQEIMAGRGEPKRSENVILLGYELMNAERHNKKLWSHLQRKNYIWTKLTLAVATYNHLIDIEANPNDIIDYQFEIMNEIGEYSTFRKITLGIEEYLKSPNEAEDIVENTIKQKLYKKR